MLRLHIKAPFAVFRTFNTGSFRPTADFMTHSAAYGLLLNLTGIESRRDDGKSPMTLMRDALPEMHIALGAVTEFGTRGESHPILPAKATVFQQLHNYPVGTTGSERAPLTKGTKYNITPVRREFLTEFQAILHVEAKCELEDQVVSGLTGTLPAPRYGLPFLGDNAFLPDWVRQYDSELPVHWLEKVAKPDAVESGNEVFRLTQWIDRSNSANTISGLFALISEPRVEPPVKACVKLPPPA